MGPLLDTLLALARPGRRSGPAFGATVCVLVLAGSLAAAAPAPAGTAASPGAAVAPSPSEGCSKPQDSLRFTASVPEGRATFTALVNVPPGQPAGTPLPMVLVFHAAGSNPLAAEAQTGFSSLGNREGFIAVYPYAGHHYWDLSSPREYGYVRDLLDRLQDTVCVDKNRVYATGVSNGASLVSRLGCLLSDRLAAIAPVAGDDGLFAGCTPTHPLSVLEIHGSEDTAVPYDGTKEAGTGGVWAFLGAWDRWDSCPSTLPVWRRLAHQVLYAAKAGCQNGAVVAHIKLLREPHAWPSLSHSSGNVAFSARQAVWQFFSTHTVTATSGSAKPAPAPRRTSPRQPSSGGGQAPSSGGTGSPSSGGASAPPG